MKGQTKAPLSVMGSERLHSEADQATDVVHEPSMRSVRAFFRKLLGCIWGPCGDLSAKRVRFF